EHRMLVIYEAAGLQDGFQAYVLRSLLSEGKILYDTVEKTGDGALGGRRIEKKGPTGLIVTTTAANLHPENETRLISVSVSDTRAQTRLILDGMVGGARTEEPLEPWHALQVVLELGERRVVIPFDRRLVALIPPVAVRLRRDVGALLSLIEAHAILHQESR